ncbi:MAG: DUF2306 domain-containing protein [Ardenticatenaceae bacterium]|nr:DUF2306 domain-containing protein [Ardenticatenaceae bacterium]
MSTLGWIHTIFGLVALAAGTAVIFLKKGGRWHRTLGHIYLTNMLALNMSALFIYRLYGRFGPFHWMAVASLLTLIVGMVPVFTRLPKGSWLQLHAAFINGSYVGLVAGFVSEITSRIPGTEEHFGLVVGVTTALIIGIGATLIHRNLPQSLTRVPARFRRETQTAV